MNNFFENLSQYGVLVSKAPASSRAANPVIRMRENFANNVTKQIGSLDKLGDRKRQWFYVEDDKYHLTVRNGNTILKLMGKEVLVVDDAVKAEAFYRGAIEACNEGLFDKQLLETQKPAKGGSQ